LERWLAVRHARMGMCVTRSLAMSSDLAAGPSFSPTYIYAPLIVGCVCAVMYMLHFLQAASDFSLLFRFMWSSWRRFASVINLQPKPHGVLPFSIRLGDKEQSGAAGQYLAIGGSSLWPVSLLFNTHTSSYFFA